MEHRRVLSSQTYGFSFASAKPTSENTLKYRLLFLPHTFSLLNCQSVGILDPEIVLSFTLGLTGEMRVTLL